ncbi:MAG: 3-isopropylmalate dehydratase large subunit [Anaerolineae bacterium]|nr:3-isopropylmalate dehydratase large subunit [Anaerolineae bacterium]
MGYTFVEKILAKNAGLAEVTPGQVLDATPDVALSHDNTAAISKTFYSLGIERVKYPERLAITLDHAAPPPTTQHAQNHADVRRFVAAQGVKNFFEVGRGICHQVLCEEGLIYPGVLLLGADSHSTHYGALGAFGAGVGRSEMAAIWATGQLWLRVPESIKITLHGVFKPWVTSKDIALFIIGRLGADGGLYASVEFHGEAVAGMSMESRFVLPNMMAEMGAKNSWVAQDGVTFAWLEEQGSRSEEARKRRGESESESKIENRKSKIGEWERTSRELSPEPDAAYLAEYEFEAGEIEPQVACPHSVDNVKPLSAVAGTKIDQAFLGTCTNGRLEDIAVAAQIMAGRRVAPGTRLLVIPASSQVYLDAVKAGYVETLLAAGATFGSPGCGPCMGNHMGIPAPGEATISSANRNFRGRMGTRESDIYLASPAVVAASAIVGKIAGPEQL